MRTVLRISACLLFFLIIMSSVSFEEIPKEVIYPSSNPRFAEHIEILRTALEKTVPGYGPYTLKPAEVEMNELRYLKEAETGKLVNVVWSASTAQKEKDLIPIRIPLTKGLLGFRIALIRSDMQKKIDLVQSADDLSKLSFGLGYGWGDVSIYKTAGFNVSLANYENLFPMLNSGRFDIFSRGVNEVFIDFEAHRAQNPNIAVEKNLLIHYPFPYYFFVTPSDPRLARRIEAGLWMMIKDGSFNAIFWKYNGKAITQARMNKRRIIELVNPDLPPQTALDNPALWYYPYDKNL